MCQEQSSAVRFRAVEKANTWDGSSMLKNEPRLEAAKDAALRGEAAEDPSKRDEVLCQWNATETANTVVENLAQTPTKTRGGSSKKFGPDVVDALQQIVQENPSFTLERIKRALKEEMPNIEVSTSTIDRLLDGHGYSVKLLTQRPVDRNRADVKQLRRRYAQWLQSEGTTLTRYYIDETNFNVWCLRSFGRAKRGLWPAHHHYLILYRCLRASGRRAVITTLPLQPGQPYTHGALLASLRLAVFLN
ncbi:hypothetical protein HPB52_023577 [Rhipicephalus sanguineus]|uniref:Uncharacterized protein n=1 Tax=Rhipicephalus sanguineus TaxID=34632 RepID=A0A9D4TC69_RHISA|nr:hypothetical protein HPB52_023577 [Rhipicephalus sanguineus]